MGDVIDIPANQQKRNKRGLTPAQEKALELLVAGSSVKAAAEAAGVSRQACSVWVNKHEAFAAALKAERAETYKSAARMLGGMAEHAATIYGLAIAGKLKGNDGRLRLEAARDVLNKIGLSSLVAQEEQAASEEDVRARVRHIYGLGDSDDSGT